MFGRTMIALRAKAKAIDLAARLAQRSPSPYAVFTKATKGKYPGLLVPARSKLVAKAWKALSAAKKAQYAAIAKKTTFKRKPKAPKKRRAGPFAKFVQANYKSVLHLPFTKRVRVLAKQWNAQKKQ
jgi:hypothetical protein